MARRLVLSPIGIGRLIVFSGAVLVYGAHQMAVKVGLVDPAEPHGIHSTTAPSRSFAERNARARVSTSQTTNPWAKDP